jgi:hypothetical protein
MSRDFNWEFYFLIKTHLWVFLLENRPSFSGSMSGKWARRLNPEGTGYRDCSGRDNL